jgi:hypothetical protein
VELEDDGVGEGPLETGSDGQDCPPDEEETENQKPPGHHQTP